MLQKICDPDSVPYYVKILSSSEGYFLAAFALRCAPDFQCEISKLCNLMSAHFSLSPCTLHYSAHMQQILTKRATEARFFITLCVCALYCQPNHTVFPITEYTECALWRGREVYYIHCIKFNEVRFDCIYSDFPLTFSPYRLMYTNQIQYTNNFPLSDTTQFYRSMWMHSFKRTYEMTNIKWRTVIWNYPVVFFCCSSLFW